MRKIGDVGLENLLPTTFSCPVIEYKVRFVGGTFCDMGLE